MSESILSEKTVLFFVGVPNPTEKEALMQYSKESQILSQKAGAKPLGQFGVREQIIGETPVAFFAFAEYPNEQAARDLFESDAYKELIPLREKAFHSLSAFVAAPGQEGQIIDSNKSLTVTFANPNPANKEAMMQYGQGTQALAQEHGINQIVRYPIKDRLFGDLKVGIIGFAELEQDQDWKDLFASKEYQQLLPARKLAFEPVNVYALQSKN